MIDFRCGQCGKLLRTPDDAAGKQAQCPSCGLVQPVPAAREPVAGNIPFQEAIATPPASTNPYAGAAYSIDIAPGGEWAPPGFAPINLDLGEVLRRSWAIFRNRWGACLGTFALGIGGVLMLYLAVIAGIVLVISLPGRELFTVPIGIAVGLVCMLLLLVLGIGIISAMLKIARGQELTAVDYYGGGACLPRFFGGWLIWTVIQYGTMLACLAPALILQVTGRIGVEASLLSLGGNLLYYVVSTWLMLLFWMAPLLIVDQGAGPINALERSRQLTRGRRLVLFVIGLVATLIYIAGFFACLVGALFTAPFSMLMGIVVYLAITGEQPAQQAGSPPDALAPLPS